MRRLLLRFVGVAVCTWLEFSVFPGHTFLQAGTQLSVPMLERLANPGFLSRDLVATHSDLEYTAYDEITLSLAEATRSGFQQTLEFQQIASRAAAVLGIALLALSLGMGEVLALFISAIVNLGALLAGPGVAVVDAEAIPRALAWGPLVLVAGLLAREKPLLAGVCAGTALLYDPALTAPLCIWVLIALITDRRLRRLLRPAFTVICVFALLLANLAQLQPGIVEHQPVFSTISTSFGAIQRFRTPHIWVTAWPRAAVFSYLMIWVSGLWAVARIWPALNRQCRWLLLALPLTGVLGLTASYILLDRLKWAFVPHLQPAQWLVFTVAFSSLACLAAAVKAAKRKKFIEASLWFLVPFSMPVHAELLNLRPEQLAIVIAFAAVSALCLTLFSYRRATIVLLVIPLAAIFLLGRSKPSGVPPTVDLADWVKQNTWGSSMFLFPDLGRSRAPGEFRARSQRALWVDWNSGGLVPLFPSFASVWWERWQQTMQSGYAPQRLQSDLALPIDYYVLTRSHRLAGIKPVFSNAEFLVYDANDLRNADGPLQTAVAR
ncbi:MAG TPA: hypothetical protein VH302_15440 [Bryobacteraceae bacterium]|nr:hypothetical protein [Bryobacteraceae bacterium]